jgi:hypothetical protein
MSELRHWKRLYSSYYSASKMAVLPIKDQQAFLFRCLDKELSARLARQVTDTTPVLAVPNVIVESCMSLLTGFFHERNPLLIRRKKFFSCYQQDGQDELAYREQLRSLAEEADIQQLTYDDCLCLMFMMGLKDRNLKEKLGAEEPTLARFNQVLESHVQSRLSVDRGTVNAAQPRPAPNKQQQQQSAPAAKRRAPVSDAERARRKAFQGRCWRCGSDHMRSKCNVSGNCKCEACGETGHLAVVCLKRSGQAKAAQPSPSPLPLEYSHPAWHDQAQANWVGPARVDWTGANRPTPELPL